MVPPTLDLSGSTIKTLKFMATGFLCWDSQLAHVITCCYMLESNCTGRILMLAPNFTFLVRITSRTACNMAKSMFEAQGVFLRETLPILCAMCVKLSTG
jgi:hypothetical protein